MLRCELDNVGLPTLQLPSSLVIAAKPRFAISQEQSQLSALVFTLLSRACTHRPIMLIGLRLGLAEQVGQHLEVLSLFVDDCSKYVLVLLTDRGAHLAEVENRLLLEVESAFERGTLVD